MKRISKCQLRRLLKGYWASSGLMLGKLSIIAAIAAGCQRMFRPIRWLRSQRRTNSYRGRLIMLDEYFISSSTLHRNERVKLAAMFWNIVGAGMFIGGVAGAFFYEGPLFWGKVGIAVVGIVLALIFQRVGDRLLGYLRAQ